MKKSEIDIIKEDSFITISPPELLTDKEIDTFKATLIDICGHTNKHILLDFKDIIYLYSRTIGIIIRAQRIQHENNRKIAIINASEDIKNLLKSINVFKIIPLVDTVEEFVSKLEDAERFTQSLQPVAVVTETSDAITVVRIQGEVEDIHRTNLIEEFEKAFKRITDIKIIIDFGPLIGLSTDFLFSIVAVADNIKRNKGRLMLAAVNCLVKELFEVLDIEDRFEFVDTIEDGINLMRQ